MSTRKPRRRGRGAWRGHALLAFIASLLAADSAFGQSSPSPGDVFVEDAEALASLSEAEFGSVVDVYLVPLQALSGSVLPRWRTREDGGSRTITIHYERPSVAYGLGYRWAINQALEHWTRVPGVSLRFQEAAGPETADVTVRWVPGFPMGKGGLTSWETDNDGWIRTAVLELALVGDDGEPIQRQLARRIAIHEVGHLLGLPHSDEPGDVMYPTSEREHLSVRDRQTLQLLYAVKPWSILDLEEEGRP